MESVKVGSILNDVAVGRDAIHIAIAPVVAAEKLWAGYSVGLLDDGTASTHAETKIGIVDPFIKGPIRRGDKFYLFLFPNTVTSLRHVWTHPAFKSKLPKEAICG
jgi:hypothetical protein